MMNGLAALAVYRPMLNAPLLAHESAVQAPSSCSAGRRAASWLAVCTTSILIMQNGD